MSQPRILNLGILGLGADWDSRYAPAINKLGARMRVGSFYDNTPERVRNVAPALGATGCHGVREILHTRIDALIILDLGWQGEWTVATAVKANRPLFIGRDCCLSAFARDELRRVSSATGTLIVPEPRLRYEPSLLRLRELLASRLGEVREVALDLTRARSAISEGISLADLLGWCRVTFNLAIDRMTVRPTGDAEVLSGEVMLAVSAKSHSGLSICVGTASSHQPADDAAPFIAVTCAGGRVELLGPRQLRWNTGDDWISETLGADRSATDVAVDLFTRRAVGGLIPVPDLADLDHAERLAALVSAVIERKERTNGG